LGEINAQFKEFDESFAVAVEFKIVSDGKRRKVNPVTPVDLGTPRIMQ
jgi:hypothetical protein